MNKTVMIYVAAHRITTFYVYNKIVNLCVVDGSWTVIV